MTHQCKQHFGTHCVQKMMTILTRETAALIGPATDRMRAWQDDISNICML